MSDERILEVKDLRVSFKTYSGIVQAVRGVNLELQKGEVLAIVGESGCGKTVTAKSIMRLLPAGWGPYYNDPNALLQIYDPYDGYFDSSKS